MSLLCVSCFLHTHTHKHKVRQNCCSILKSHHERGRKTERNFQNITLIKYSCSSGILLCSFSIRRSEVEKACYWSLSKKEKERKERETYFLWGKTENRMNSATVDGKLLTATTKWTTDDCKRAAVWVSDRIQLQTESLLQWGSDNMYVYRLWSDAAACRSCRIGLNMCKPEQLRDWHKTDQLQVHKRCQSQSQERVLNQPEM